MADAKLLDGLFGLDKALPGQDPITPRRKVDQYEGDGIEWTLTDDPVTQRTRVHAAVAPTPFQKLSSLIRSGSVTWIADSPYVARTGSAATSWTDTTGTWVLGNAVGAPLWEPTGWNGKGSIFLSTTASALHTSQSPIATFASGNDRPLTMFGLFQLTATADTNSTICGWVNTGTPTRMAVIRGQAASLVSAFPRISDGTTTLQQASAGAPNTSQHSFGWVRHGATATFYLDGTALTTEGALDVPDIVGLNRFGVGNIGVSGFVGTPVRLRQITIVDRAIGPVEMAQLRAAAAAYSDL
jgi:hypothetical protein